MKVLKQIVCFLGVLVMAWSLNVSAAMAAQPPVEVAPITDEDLAAVVYGGRVVVQEGTEYYASAYGFGSGPHGTIGNRYTQMGVDIYIGGFALLDEDGELVEYRGYNPKNVPVASNWQNDIEEMPWDNVWVEIFLDPDHDSPIGWVPMRSIIVLNGIIGDGGSNERFQNGVKIVPKDDPPEPTDVPEEEVEPNVPEADETLENEWEFDVSDPEDLSAEIIDIVLPDPGNVIEDRIIKGQDDNDEDTDASEDAFISTREIAYAIEDYAENGEKVALLLDASNSVSEYMADIADYGEYVDKVNQAETIVAFARKFQVITIEEYLDVDVKNDATNIYAPLNSLADASYDRIIIVTDTEHNAWFAKLYEQTDFSGKIVIVCTCELNNVERSVVRKIEKAFDTTVYLCRLDNELDRIQTMEALEK